MPFITDNIGRAASDLKAGKPVAIPTETVYGLAAMINQEAAIRAVFNMKDRPLHHPLIVHVATTDNLNHWVEEIPEYAQKLIDHFWPGPLTLVLRAKMRHINPLITGGQTTVAIRCPNHPMTQKLLAMLKTPLVAPSANPFGKISPTTAQHVKQSFPNEELTILDGGRCDVGIESTIVDATNPHSFQILRHGMIDEQAIREVISTAPVKSEQEPRVPGAMSTHYQPKKMLYYFEKPEVLDSFCLKRIGDVYAIAFQKPLGIENDRFHLLSQEPEKAAFELYYQLRLADDSDTICIAIELPPAEGQWQGIREKIIKAGQPYSR
ncbi:MAG: threonylcarbamoyl-AMP synthase [Legionella sp.]|nr:MAG: threonylcarbamoyl-AMP synthase [Legionella sp.]